MAKMAKIKAVQFLNSPFLPAPSAAEPGLAGSAPAYMEREEKESSVAGLS